MASIKSLPTETITHIFSFVHTPFSLEPVSNTRCSSDVRRDFDASLHDLQRAARVCRHWLDLAQPMLWRYLHVRDSTDAFFLNNSPALGRFHTDQLDLSIWSDEWDRNTFQEDFERLLKGMKGLKKLVISGEKWTRTEWLGMESLKDLKVLNIDVVISGRLHSTPKFQLTALEVGCRWTHPGFYPLIFESSSHTLTSLKVDASRGSRNHATLRAALPLVPNTLRSLEIVGELQGLGAILPILNTLTHVRFTPSSYGDQLISFLSAAFQSLPSCTTVVTVRLPLESFDFRRVVESLIRSEDGWERLTNLEVEHRRIDDHLASESYRLFARWAELEEICAEKGVTIIKLEV
ncbi:hypothetical protein P7C70_g7566, partial [Phenoliferia sp. Uapishka_3]